MREPAFWYSDPGIVSASLAPLGALYAYGTARRLQRGPRTRVGIPVICVGNINAGGTGKTPTVIALLERLQARGASAHVVSRGYGGSAQGPLQVDERVHSADLVGDEPKLIAAFAPTWVSKDRLVGAIAAKDAGADVIVLDDGFQNPSLGYDLSLVVVDAARGFGNGRVIPAGPLREPVAVGLARADLVLSIGPDKAQSQFREHWQDALPCPHITGHLEPLQTGMDWEGTRVLAFAGIGYPEKFFATVRGLGAELVKTESLEDHQPLSVPLMKRLEAEASLLGAQLVTTEKDATRLPRAFRLKVITVPVRLQIPDPEPLDRLLDAIVQPR